MTVPPARPTWIDSGRVPGLDGLRAVAVGLVLWAHAAPTAFGRGFSAVEGAIGAVGVDAFFVISGFLITLLLVRERSGRIDLPAFYVRRVLRIVPAYLAYLAFVAALAHVGLVFLRPVDWAAALTYTTNFLHAPAWVILHTWSLSVEEHFYLLWPPAFVLLGRGAVPALAAVVLAGPAVRYALWQWTTLNIAYATPARIDTLAAGCLLAFLAASPRGASTVARLSRRPVAMVSASVLAILVSKAVLCRSGKYAIALDRTAVAMALCVAVLACVSSPRSPLSRLLGWRPVAYVGTLSYSLYLWQEPFLGDSSSAWMCRWPRNLVLVAICAVACHYLVERPFLRLKDRIGRRKHG